MHNPPWLAVPQQPWRQTEAQSKDHLDGPLDPRPHHQAERELPRWPSRVLSLSRTTL